MHAVETHRTHHPSRHHSSHHSHHAHLSSLPPPAAHSRAVEFLSGIQLACDPSVPPPELFPFVSFEQAVRAWLDAGGTSGGFGQQIASTAEESLEWDRRRREACVAFLGNITMGTEEAGERPQPVINLPIGYFMEQQQRVQQQQQQLQLEDDHARRIEQSQREEAQRRIDLHPASSDALPPHHPDLTTRSSSTSASSSTQSGAPLLVHASSLKPVPLDSRASTGGGLQAANGELLLYPNGDTTQSNSSNSSGSGSFLNPNVGLAPLRIQTPPLLMGLSSAGGVVAGANSLAVGANLFSNPLMFPSTLAPPIGGGSLQPPSEMRRAVTFQPGTAEAGGGTHHLHTAFHLPGVTLGRSISERAASSRQSGISSSTVIPGVSGRIPTNVPTAEQQQLEQDVGAGGVGGGIGGKTIGSQGDEQSSMPDDPSKTPSTNAVPGIDHSGGDQMLPPSSTSHSVPFLSSYLRSDGTGRGLRDQEALFIDTFGLIASKVTANGSAGAAAVAAAAQAQEDWEHHLLSRGLLDPRARRIYTSGSLGQAGSTGRHGVGAPVMISSLQPWIARDVSTSSSGSHTPTTGGGVQGGKSRSGSFSADAGAGEMMVPLQLKSGRELDGSRGLHSSAGVSGAKGARLLSTGFVGRNPLLSLALAASAAFASEEQGGGAGDLDDDGGAGPSSTGAGGNSGNAGGGGMHHFFSGYGGKRKGTSYGYLLPYSLAGRKATMQRQQFMSSSLASSAGDSEHHDSSQQNSDASALLTPTASALSASLHPSQVDTNDVYDPFLLDDPNIKSGKHRVVLNLPGFMSSLISYVRTKDLKLELNEAFAARNEEWLAPGSKMSLSKIRKLKELLLEIGQTLKLEISTIAVAYIYLEKLILSNEVDKANRKLMSAVCLLLAIK